MTKLAFKTVTCAVCGRTFPISKMMSSNQMGLSDLDMRPAKMLRHTMSYWVTCCYSCAYCSDDIEKIESELIPVVLSKEYHDTFSAVGYSAQASYFRCKALLDTKRQHYNDAFWATMHAAWTCDDQGDAREARFCRLDALRLFKVAKHAGQEIHGDEENESLLFIDILRRAERFDEAQAEIDILRNRSKDATIRKILDYQDYLVIGHDISAHTIDDAYEYSDKRNMYIADVSKAELKKALKKMELGFFRDAQEIDTGDMMLFKYKTEITHYATVKDRSMIVYEIMLGPNGEFPELKSHFISFFHITALKKSLPLHELLPDDASSKYLYLDEFKKVESEDQTILEKLIMEDE